MKKYLTVFILLFVLTSNIPIYANGGPTTIKGTDDSILIPAKNNQVAVTHEELNYKVFTADKLGSDGEPADGNSLFYAEVSAKYFFLNEGTETEEVTIAFPFDSASAEASENSVIVLMNGDEVPHQVLKIDNSSEHTNVTYTANNNVKWDPFEVPSFADVLELMNNPSVIYTGGYTNTALHLIIFEVPFTAGKEHVLEVKYVTRASKMREVKSALFHKYGEWEAVFHYFLEPASYWKSFENIDVSIEVPMGFEIGKISLLDIKKIDERHYTGSFETLPKENLVFTVKESETNKSIVDGITLSDLIRFFAIFTVILVALAIGILLKFKIRKW